jgi:hypothetical protein
MSDLPLTPNARRPLPIRDFWALNIPGAFPLAPTQLGPVPLTPTDFPDGSDIGAAFPVATSFIRGGFNLNSAEDLDLRPLPTREDWSRAVADALSSAVTGLRAAHSLTPDMLNPPFQSLTDSETAALLDCREAAALLNAFFGRTADDLDYYDSDDVCFKCFSLADPGTDEERLARAFRECAGDITIARTSLFNERVREISSELELWKDATLAAAQTAICDTVCDRQINFDIFPDGSQPFRDWVTSWLSDPAIASVVKLWFAERVESARNVYSNDYDVAKASLSANYSAEVDAFRAHCESSLADSRANIQATTENTRANLQAEADKEILAYKHQLRCETDQLKANVLHASNKASLEAAVINDLKAALGAQAQAELDQFTQSLKSQNESLKEKARKMADAGLQSAKRVASGSSRKLSSRPPSARPTPRLTISTLPGQEVVPSSQTPPAISTLPHTPDGSLSPIALISQVGIPVPPSPHKRTRRSDSTTPTPRDPVPPTRPYSPSSAQVPPMAADPLAPPATQAPPMDTLTATLAALTGQLQAINSRLDRIESRDEDRQRFDDEVYRAQFLPNPVTASRPHPDHAAALASQLDYSNTDGDGQPAYGVDGQGVNDPIPEYGPIPLNDARNMYARIFNVSLPPHPAPISDELDMRISNLVDAYRLYCTEHNLPHEMNPFFVSKRTITGFIQAAGSFVLRPLIPPGQDIPGLTRELREVFQRRPTPEAPPSTPPPKLARAILHGHALPPPEQFRPLPRRAPTPPPPPQTPPVAVSAPSSALALFPTIGSQSGTAARRRNSPSPTPLHPPRLRRPKPTTLVVAKPRFRRNSSRLPPPPTPTHTSPLTPTPAATSCKRPSTS